MQIASPNPPMPPVTSATRCVSCAMCRSSYAFFIEPSALDCQRDAHAAADAQRGEAFLRVAPAHLVQQRDEHAAAGSADGMPERNGAAVDVDPARVPAHFLVH